MTNITKRMKQRYARWRKYQQIERATAHLDNRLRADVGLPPRGTHDHLLADTPLVGNWRS
jgi:hypothetical protein